MIRILSLILFGALAVPANAAPVDPYRDSGFEERVFRIYQQYLSQPIPDSFWVENFGQLQEEVYRIQPGDTLWEISKVFFGDGFYWSKLWAVNGQITNPHQIQPGYELRFLGGNLSMSPQVSLDPMTDAPPASSPLSFPEPQPSAPMSGTLADSGYTDGSSDDFGGMTSVPVIRGGGKNPVYLLPGAPEIPPPEVSSRPLLKTYPPTLKGRVTDFSQQFDDVGLSIEDRPQLFEDPVVTLPSYITDSELQVVGEVSEHELSNQTASNLQYTYLKLNQRAELGEKFILAQKDEWVRFQGSTVGQVIDVMSQVVITDIVDEGNLVYRGLISGTVNPVRVGAKVVRGFLPRFTMNLQGQPKTIVAHVVGGQFSQDREILGESAIVYLNAGSNQGLQSGDLLAVTGDRRLRLESANITYGPDYAAIIKVVQVFPGVSTALIVRSFSEVRPGDLTGATIRAADLSGSSDNAAPFFEAPALPEGVSEQNGDDFNFDSFDEFEGFEDSEGTSEGELFEGDF